MRFDLRSLAVVRPWALLALLSLVFVGACGGDKCSEDSTDPSCYEPGE